MTASFRRAPDFDRRTDMIEATLDCIADLGIQATTVRAVAARAGVSNGLIRHHFAPRPADAVHRSQPWWSRGRSPDAFALGDLRQPGSS